MPVGVGAADPTTTVRLARGAVAVAVGSSGEQVEGEQAVDAGRVRPVRRRHRARRHADVAHHRPGLLRQPGLVEAAHDVALEHRRRAEDLAHRHHAGAADAREADDELVAGHERTRRGQTGGGIVELGRISLDHGLRPVVVDGDGGERRAVAGEARHVEVAARLVDARLAPVRRLHRLHRQAVALVAAVAAALAHPLVDHHPEAGLGQPAAAAGPSVLGGARLVVHQHRDAGHLGQHLLRLEQASPVPHLDPVAVLAELGIVVGVGILGGDDDPPHAFEQHELHHLGHGHLTRRVLAAGHRHGAVVEQLERDVVAGRDTPPGWPATRNGRTCRRRGSAPCGRGR